MLKLCCLVSRQPLDLWQVSVTGHYPDRARSSCPDRPFFQAMDECWCCRPSCSQACICGHHTIFTKSHFQPLGEWFLRKLWLIFLLDSPGSSGSPLIPSYKVPNGWCCTVLLYLPGSIEVPRLQLECHQLWILQVNSRSLIRKNFIRIILVNSLDLHLCRFGPATATATLHSKMIQFQKLVAPYHTLDTALFCAVHASAHNFYILGQACYWPRPCLYMLGGPVPPWLQWQWSLHCH